MNFETLINEIISGKDICIEYSKINGKETIKINGEKIEPQPIKKEIEKYKSLIEKIDDCLFMDVCDEMANIFYLKNFEDLLAKDSYNDEEITVIEQCLDVFYKTLKKKATEKIEELNNLISQC